MWECDNTQNSRSKQHSLPLSAEIAGFLISAWSNFITHVLDSKGMNGNVPKWEPSLSALLTPREVKWDKNSIWKSKSSKMLFGSSVSWVNLSSM